MRGHPMVLFCILIVLLAACPIIAAEATATDYTGQLVTGVGPMYVQTALYTAPDGTVSGNLFLSNPVNPKISSDHASRSTSKSSVRFANE